MNKVWHTRWGVLVGYLCKPSITVTDKQTYLTSRASALRYSSCSRLSALVLTAFRSWSYPTVRDFISQGFDFLCMVYWIVPAVVLNQWFLTCVTRTPDGFKTIMNEMECYKFTLYC
jgi:hypothetical protein